MDLKELEESLEKYNDYYDIKVIGQSFLGKNIYAVSKEFDKSYKWALLVGGIHAREHLSSDLVVKFIRDFYLKKLNFNISFVPLANPDGADLCINGISRLDKDLQENLVRINGGEDFSLFKANARGVDLNNNFDANWEKKFSNITSFSSQGFYGEKPMSEMEVIALANWAKSLDLFITISYHLKGEEIYFDFFQDRKDKKRDKKIAKIFAKSSGYKIKSTEKISSGGFKDWCVQNLRIPALTIELGNDRFSHPYPASEIENIYKKNTDIIANLQKSLEIYQKYAKK